MNDLFRVYLDPAEIGLDGYPYAWHGTHTRLADGSIRDERAIKDLLRERDGHRCLRCGHPYRKGEHGNGQWSPCDEHCTHTGSMRWQDNLGNWYGGEYFTYEEGMSYGPTNGGRVEAEWRILTVHHLNGIKHDCRWWNLVSLCQRCHLTIQGRVVMARVWPWEHTDWFKPYAAGWYAFSYLGEELTREETLARLDELLSLELAAPREQT